MADGDAGDIVLPIRLSSEEAERTWEALKKRFGQPIPPPPFTPPPKDKDPGSWFDNIREKMLTYRREETQQARFTRFFANEIAGLVPVGNQAGAVLGKMAFVLGSGLSIGAGVEIVKWGIETIVEYFRKAEEAERALFENTQKLGTDLQKAALDAKGGWQEFIAALSDSHLTDAQKRANAEVRAGNKEWQDAQVELRGARQELERLYGADKALSDRNTGRGFWSRFFGADTADLNWDAWIRQVERGADTAGQAAAKRYREAFDRASKAELKTGVVAAGLPGAQSAELDEKRLSFQKLILAEAAKGVGEERRLRDELALHLQELDRDRLKYGDQYQALRFATEAAGNRAILNARRNHELELATTQLEAAKVFAGEEMKVRMDGDLAIQKLQAQIANARAAGDQAEVDRLFRLVDARARLTKETLDYQRIVESGKRMEAGLDQLDATAKAETTARKKQFEEERAFEFLRQASWRGDIASRLDALKKAEDSELDLVTLAHSKGKMEHEEYERAKAEITERYALQRRQALLKESVADQAMRDLGMSAMNNFANTIGNAYGSLVMHSKAYEEAQAKMSGAVVKGDSDVAGSALALVQAVVGAVAQEAAVKAAFYAAEGLAAMAFPVLGNPAGYFAAAGAMASVAAMAGAAAWTIGEVRPMSGSERASLATGSAGYGTGAAAEAGGARAAGGSSSGGGIVRETVILVGSAFETPQETARRAARTIALARQLNMIPA